MPRDGEIGPERVRRKRARNQAKPRSGSPASATTETRVSARKAATCYPESSVPAPPSEPIGGSDASGESGAPTASLPIIKTPHLANIVSELAALQRRRRFCIQQQSRADRSIESLIASTLGFRIDATEKERKSVFARAKAYRQSVERGGEGQRYADAQSSAALSALAPMILVSAATRAPWDDLRKQAEKEMIRLAKSLPVYEWARSIKGFGDKGLAIIVGEAGIPIGEYRTVEGFWKRMGLAVIDGERQRGKTDKVQAAAHGYSPKRRAEIWMLAHSMFKAQWNGDKDEDGKNPAKTGKPIVISAHAAGPYGEIYAARRASTTPRIEATADLLLGSPEKWIPLRCFNDAVRVMSKALLRDLWVEWRRSC